MAWILAVDDEEGIRNLIQNALEKDGHRVSVCKNTEVIKEKDFITCAKPRGYRSYHLILEIEDEVEDVLGNTPGHYYAEVQLRTIAMDSWASLEHQMQYKREIRNKELISRELKRCADELAACDVSMQTIRMMIKEA